MSVQNGCRVKESVIIKVTKALEDWSNVAQVTYMIIVPQRSDCILVFLHTPGAQSPNMFPSTISKS